MTLTAHIQALLWIAHVRSRRAHKALCCGIHIMGNTLQKFLRSDVSLFSKQSEENHTFPKCPENCVKRWTSAEAEAGQRVSRPTDARGDVMVPSSDGPHNRALSWRTWEEHWLTQGGYVLSETTSDFGFVNVLRPQTQHGSKANSRAWRSGSNTKTNHATADTSVSSVKPSTTKANNEVTVFWKKNKKTKQLST